MILAFFSIILFLYVLLIVQYIVGWNRIRTDLRYDYLPNTSVIIALRNEADHIPQLLSSLADQDYPNTRLEYILVNDHSTDDTLDLIKQSVIPNLKILEMGEKEFGKKCAISKGVSAAIGDVILVSDADCDFKVSWVKTMVSHFYNDDIKLVSGPVVLNKVDSFFQNLQGLEFISLISSGAGAIGIGKPMFCNGANMAYRKEVFLELNNSTHGKIASGDDVFLLHAVKAKYPNAITFAKNENAIVKTSNMASLSDFINQRKRWTAKSIHYQDAVSIYTSYIVLFVNISFLIFFCMLFFDSSYMYFFISFYIVKLVVDSFLLLPALKFFNRLDLAKWIAPFELVYSFYISLIVFLSFTSKFEWKGRIHRK